MPCSDYGPTLAERRERAVLPAVMCAVIRKYGLEAVQDCIDDEATDNVEYLRQGLYLWWTEHQVADAKRRQYEAERKRRGKLQLDALTKLSEDEVEALGIDIAGVLKNVP